MATGSPKRRASMQLDNEYRIEYDGKKSKEEILNPLDINFSSIFTKEGDNKNSLYFGDNLKILKGLLKNPNVKGKVKLIYIDPPYASNNIFQSRDGEFAYEDTLRGAEFIEFLRERFILLHELLSDDGSMYVHLDEKMIFEAKIILDEIFGPNNFQNFIVRKKSNPKNSTKNKYGNITDYILFYSKSSKFIWNQQFEPWDKETGEKEYSYIEEHTGRRYKKVPIHAPGVRNGETGKEWRGMLPPPGKHWQYLPSKLNEMDERGEIYWSKNGNPRRKIYLDNSPGISVQNVWMDFKDAHNQNINITGYPTEKNKEILVRIVKASSNEGDLVLDAFVGSGTTIEVAEELGRRWIGIDSSPLALKTNIIRLAKGTKPMGDFKSNQGSVQAELFSNSVLKNGFNVLMDKEDINDSILKDVEKWKELF